MILVTGGGGFLGGHIVDRLVARGERVRVLGRSEYPRLTALGVETICGDVRNSDDVRNACRDVTTVFHVAAVPGVWGPRERYFSINTDGTQNVIDACLAEGVGRLVHTSSPSVIYDGTEHEGSDESLPYPAPDAYLCHYPASKADAERRVLAANGSASDSASGRLFTTAMRPHLIWGPRDNHLLPRLFEKARSGRLRAVGDRTNLVSMSYVENAADAHLRAADALREGSPVNGRAYFINEPEPVNLWQWVDDLLGLVDLPPLKKRIGEKAAYRVGAVCEAVWKTLRLGGEPPMTRFVAQQLAGSHWYDVTAARNDFGYAPDVGYEEALRRTGEWFAGKGGRETAK